jgi:hypothetical protein
MRHKWNVLGVPSTSTLLRLGTTAFAGIIATEFGPVVGGRFLAFPAILPAGATSIEKHEKSEKAESGLQGYEACSDCS